MIHEPYLHLCWGGALCAKSNNLCFGIWSLTGLCSPQCLTVGTLLSAGEGSAFASTTRWTFSGAGWLTA